MPTKLLLIFLLFISITSHSQTAESFEYDPASIRKLDSVRENIYGAWFLANTFILGKEKNDTISKKVYNTSKESPATSRPKIILNFSWGIELVITEFLMEKKINTSKAKWQVLVKSADDVSPFFLEINSYSYYPEKCSYEFDGFVTEIDRDHFQLRDDHQLEESNQISVFNFVRLK